MSPLNLYLFKREVSAYEEAAGILIAATSVDDAHQLIRESAASDDDDYDLSIDDPSAWLDVGPVLVGTAATHIARGILLVDFRGG